MCGPAVTGVRTCSSRSADSCSVALGRRLDGEQRDARAIERDLHLVRLGQAFDVLVAIARQAQLDFVLAVRRESCSGTAVPPRVPNGSSSKWSSCVRSARNQQDVAARRADGHAEREAADFARGGEVALEQRRRELADGDVVEAVAGVVFGQQRRRRRRRCESRSRTALWYSVRLRRRKVSVRPGLGLAAAARSSESFQAGDDRVVGSLVGPRRSLRAACSGRAVCARPFPRLRGCAPGSSGFRF